MHHYNSCSATLTTSPTVRDRCSQRMALFQYINGKFIVAVSVLGAQFGQNLSTLLSPEGFCDLQLHNIALEAVAWPS